MLLRVVACCCAKFETGQTQIRESPKRGATKLDPFAQLFQHWWGHALALYMVSKSNGLYPSQDAAAGPSIVESCCVRLCVA